MKRFFLRSLAYLGLYLEIFSATCRWYAAPERCRWPYRTFVTEALIAAFYLPPFRAQYDFNVWVAAQPETIQTCLRINRKALAAVLEGLK